MIRDNPDQRCLRCARNVSTVSGTIRHRSLPKKHSKLVPPLSGASAAFQSMKTALAGGDLSGIATGGSLLTTLTAAAAKYGVTLGG